MKYLAAAIQFDPILGDYQGNVTRLLSLCETAAAQGARLIVAPEMATCGYCFLDRAEIAPYVEPVPGPLTSSLEEIARHHDCVIVCGVAEVETHSMVYYNTAAVVGPDGYIGKYRKVHFFSSDARWAAEGDTGFPVWDTPVGRLGVAICMDATFPETGRILALQGADVICFPTNWVGSPCPDERWISQAFENGVYWIAADRSGPERGLQFMGGSGVIDPDGSVQHLLTDGEGIVYGEIDLQRTRLRRFGEGPADKLADRRPDLYQSVLQNSYGWSPTYYHKLYGQSGLPPARASRIGVVQFMPEIGAVHENLQTIRRLLGAGDHDLIVLPECALSGPTDDETGLSDISTEEILSLLQVLARERTSLLITSVMERDGAHWCHSVVLIGADGVLHRQHQRHVPGGGSISRGAEHEPFRTVDTPIGRLGLAAGYDALFWETSRVLAGLGADLLCVPAALSWPMVREIADTGRHWNFWRTLAWENCAALAVANYPGPQYSGSSGLYVPDVRIERLHETVAPPTADVMLTGTLDTESRYIREKRAFAWRKLPLYKPLVLPSRAMRDAGH